MPAQICNKCCAKLHVAFQFKKLCEKSDSKLRTYIVKNGQLKSKTKQIQSNNLEQHQDISRNQDILNKQQDLQHEQIQQNTLDTMQPQNTCRFVECGTDIVDVYVQDSSYIQNGQSIQQGSLDPMNNYNAPQPIIQTPLQVGNYNISNVIYGTTYPITLQTLQPAPVIHNQVNIYYIIECFQFLLSIL